MNATSTLAAPPAAPSAVSSSTTNRFGPRWLNHLRAWFGLPSQRRLAQAALQIDQIRHWERELGKLSDDEMLKRGLQLRGRARGGEPLDALLPETFGLICVAALRVHRMRPYDVQLAGGVVLHHGALAEVATGEGKTLIATLPVALNALLGKGVHVTTTNDYLARRDGEWTAQIYNAIGLSVGILQQKMEDAQRAKAYRCDITYSTAAELGFDFLRDRLKLKGGSQQVAPFWSPWLRGANYAAPLDPKVQRGHHFALVDEADNIFIDEARTPLVIAGPKRLATEAEAIVYQWSDELARQMQPDEHFTLDIKKQKLELTDAGRTLVRYSKPPFGEHSHAMDKLHEHVERALHAHQRFRRDQHYMIEEDEVVLIDESTGRRMPDRHWSQGLHQAVEAKERVPISFPNEHAAQITFQSFFRLYTRLSGMSGTAIQNFWEVRRIYKLWVVPVPTNRPIQRQQLPDRVFPNEDAKMRAAVVEIKRLVSQGRPVLVGTKSVAKSETLSRLLVEAGIAHQVLNARPEVAEREAEIIAQAGRPGAVTISTNMAGRGTDIILGGNAEPVAWGKLKDKYPSRLDVPRAEWQALVEEIEQAEQMKPIGRQVAQSGGLHVLATERHEAIRVDRQLAGRAGRQGDNGSCQFFLALDDELLEGLGPERREELRLLGEKGGDGNWQGYHSEFVRAQRKLEARHYRDRMSLVIYEKQRQEILKDLGADPYVD